MDYYCTIRQNRTPDLTGKTFGRLTVLAFAGYKNYHAFWTCRCIEGNITDYPAAQLQNKNIQSCGCLSQESRVTTHTTHGKGHASEYRIWAHMIDRCYNTKAKDFPRYGGRGITVCQQWRSSFETFLTDMGPRPTSKHSIERKNNHLGYTPENTTWATAYEQARNTRRNVMLTYQDITLCVGDWAIRIGIKPATLTARIRLGWSTERALTTPVDYGNRRDVQKGNQRLLSMNNSRN